MYPPPTSYHDDLSRFQYAPGGGSLFVSACVCVCVCVHIYYVTAVISNERNIFYGR